MDMMIAARPAANITIMITQETPEYDAQMVASQTVFEKDLEKTIRKYLNDYKIETMSIYGPLDYIEHLADTLGKTFNREITIIGAGV